ncbi:MAG: hypothetical protein IJ829_01945, partial [Kiritimatiellae bacterium]|nr:hypothetical protein [Kiritimatiellia bacterium]
DAGFDAERQFGSRAAARGEATWTAEDEARYREQEEADAALDELDFEGSPSGRGEGAAKFAAAGRGGRGEREMTDEMFAAWLVMPEEMAKIAPTWHAAILRTVAETPRLAEAFKELSFRALSKDSHKAVFEAVRRSQSREVEKALKELEADRTEKISAGSRLADAKEKFIVTFHDTLGAVAVRIDEKARQYLKARRKVLAEMRARGATKAEVAAVKDEIDLFTQKIGNLKDRLELSRTAMERGAWNEGRRYMLQYLMLENKATKKWGLSEEDKSAYLDMMRIVETQGRAASYGMDPQQARLALGDMARRLGAEKWARLEEYGREFFSVMEREFLNDPRVERMWGKGMVDYFRTQAHYVTTKRVHSPEELDAIETARAKIRAANGEAGTGEPERPRLAKEAAAATARSAKVNSIKTAFGADGATPKIENVIYPKSKEELQSVLIRHDSGRYTVALPADLANGDFGSIVANGAAAVNPRMDDVIGAMFRYAGPRGGAAVLGLSESAWTAKLVGSMGAKQEVRSATWEKQQMLMQSARRNQFVIDLRDALVAAKVEGVRDVARGDKDVKPGSRYGTINYVEDGARRTLGDPPGFPLFCWPVRYYHFQGAVCGDWGLCGAGWIWYNLPQQHYSSYTQGEQR